MYKWGGVVGRGVVVKNEAVGGGGNTETAGTLLNSCN